MPASPRAIRSCPKASTPLANHVQAPAELTRRLAQIGVVPRERGAELVSQLKTGQRLVSPEGDVWRWDGFVAAAHAPTGAARRLAERARLVDIENELEQARIDAQIKRSALENAEFELQMAASTEGASREAWRAAQRELNVARERHATAEREISRHAARKATLSEAHSRLAADRAEAEAAYEYAEAGISELPSSEDTETRLAAVRSDIEGHRRMAAQVRAEAQALAREAELADRRVQAILAERTEWQNRKESAASHIDTIQTRITEVSIERSDLENAPAVFAEKRSALITEIEYAENDRRMAADALATAETLMAETDRAAKLTLEALSSSREATARAEERMEGSRRRLEDIEREIRDMLEVEPQAVAGLAEIEPGAELPPLHDIEEDLEKMRRDRERLGAVNLRAEEELREVETQHTGLVTERDDLVEAIKRLRQGIQSLNKEARERLLTSFEVVNNHFKRLFVELFGGGEAALHLIESDDPLEAGLEIIAKTAGQEAADAVAALGRRAGADRDGADLRGVLDEPLADLRAGRSRRAARRPQRRTVLQPAARDDLLDRHALRHHHAQPDHDGADEPSVRRHHGRTRRLPAGLGEPVRGGGHSRPERGVTSLASFRARGARTRNRRRHSDPGSRLRLAPGDGRPS